MKKILTLLISVGSLKTSFSQTYKNGLSLKPVNFSNIDLSNDPSKYLGRQFGLEYEYCFSEDHKVTFVLPITYGIINETNGVGSVLKGQELYITPGFKFYPGTLQKRSGHSIGIHLLLGKAWYSHSQELYFGNIDLMYFGFLINYNYSFRLWNSFYLRPEAGIGFRFHIKEDDFQFYSNEGSFIGWRAYNTAQSNLAGIANLSIGLHYRF